MGKVTIPVDVCIKRFYRAYIKVDENAERHDVEEATVDQIIENQDMALTPDPDLAIEAHDIVAISPDYNGVMASD